MSDESLEVQITYASGSESQSISELMETLSGPCASAHWSWYEPRAGALLGTDQSARDLHPLLRRGLPDFSGLKHFEELRLFWPDRSLHCVQKGERTHWYEWCCAPEHELLGFSQHSMQTVAAVRTTYPILLRNNLSSYGLGDDADSELSELHVNEYRESGNVVAWTLTGMGE